MPPEIIVSARRTQLVPASVNRVKETLLRRSFPYLDAYATDYLSRLPGLSRRRLEALLKPHSYDALNADILPRYHALKDFESAADRLADAVMKNEIIGISGDYDCDGNCSTALLVRFLQSSGLPRHHIHVHIPNREAEGYGVNRDAVAAMDGKRVSLLVALDNGTLAREPLAEARTRGLGALVIDHHPNSADHSLPAGALVVNPRRHDETLQHDDQGVADLAAVGMTWLVCRRAVQKLVERGHYAAQHLLIPDARDWLGLVATATIGDVVSMASPLNRALVQEGLCVIHEGRDPYLSALAHTAQLDPTTLDEESIAFRLAPIINAPGRLGQSVAWAFLSAADATSLSPSDLIPDAKGQLSDLAHAAYDQKRQIRNQRFLLANPEHDRALAQLTDMPEPPAQLSLPSSPVSASQHALMVLSRESNELRKLVETGVMRQARPQAQQWLHAHPDAGTLMVWGDHWHEGVIGIVAGRLKEEFGLPVLVASHDPETGLCKASARSIRVPGHPVDIGQAVRDLAEKDALLLKGGGHPMAAGMSFHYDKRDMIRRRIEEKIGDNARTARTAHQQLLPFTFDLRQTDAVGQACHWAGVQHQLRPFGEGFTKPRVGITGCEIRHIRRSRDGRHLFFTLHRPLPFVTALTQPQETAIECQAFHAVGTALESMLRQAEGVKPSPLLLSGTLSLHSHESDRGTQHLRFLLEDAQSASRHERTTYEALPMRNSDPKRKR